MAETDPLAALDSVRAALTDAKTRADEAEATAATAVAERDALQGEKDKHWKTQIAETKKLHPGTAKLLKMLMAATREEWEEVAAFLDRFDGHLPVGMVRVAEGCSTLLKGAEPTKEK